jgi:hypothetical protein
MPNHFSEDGEQIAAFARWPKSPEIMRKVADAMPLVGGPRSACERRVEDVAGRARVRIGARSR